MGSLSIVLIVGCDSRTRATVRTWVQRMGFEAVFVADATQAVTRVIAGKADVVLYFLRAANMGDLGALARLRELPGGRDLPIVAAVTSDELSQARTLGAALGIRDYLARPLEKDRLSQLLARIMPEPEPEPIVGDLPRMDGPVTIEELRSVHRAMAAKNYFERLNVAPSDGAGAIRRGYKELTQRYTPDAFPPANQEARRLLRDLYDALGEAYRTLKDADKRQSYAFRIERAKKQPGEAKRAAPAAPPPSPSPKPEPVPEITVERLPPVESTPAAPEAPEPPVEAPPTGFPRLELTPLPSRELSRPGFATQDPEESAASEDVPDFDEDIAIFDSPGPGSGPELTPPRGTKAPSGAFRDDGSQPNFTSEESGSDIWDGRRGSMRETHEELAAAARLQAVMGDYDGAVELLSQCVALQPDDPDYRYNLELNQGRRYKKKGNTGRAKQHLEMAVSCAPRGATAAQEELNKLTGGGGGGKSKRGRLSRLLKGDKDDR